MLVATRGLVAVAFLSVSAAQTFGQYSQNGCDNVRYIRINNTAGFVSMNFDEIQAWTPWGVNAARGQTTTAFSTLSTTYPASKAVDGIYVQNAAESFYNSAGTGTSEFWEVDLGASYTISNLTFYNRCANPCCFFRASTGQYMFALDSSRNLVGGTRFNLTGACIQNYSYAGLCAPSPTPSPVPTPGGCAVRYINIQNIGSGQLMNFGPSLVRA